MTIDVLQAVDHYSISVRLEPHACACLAFVAAVAAALAGLMWWGVKK